MNRGVSDVLTKLNAGILSWMSKKWDSLNPPLFINKKWIISYKLSCIHDESSCWVKEYFFDVDVVIVCVMDFIMTARIKSNPPNSVTSGAWKAIVPAVIASTSARHPRYQLRLYTGSSSVGWVRGKSVRPPAAWLVHVCVYSSLMRHTHTLVA